MSDKKVKERVAVRDTDTFAIAFDTKKYPGFIETVRVIIFHDLMDESDTVRINLCDHPLYKDLQRYVLANPR